MKKLVKTLKSVACFAFSVILLLGLVSCASKDVSGTYTFYVGYDTLALNLDENPDEEYWEGGFNGQFSKMLALPLDHTLVLDNETHTYTYTKSMTSNTFGSFGWTYIFKGQYENKDNTVTLLKPTECSFSEDYGALLGETYPAMVNVENGTITDLAFNNLFSHEAEDMHDGKTPDYLFDTPFIKFSETPAQSVQVVVDQETGTFTYVGYDLTSEEKPIVE